jgi:hypothetical protein
MLYVLKSARKGALWCGKFLLKKEKELASLISG